MCRPSGQDQAIKLLQAIRPSGICLAMTQIFDIDDRARLRERFFSEERLVAACL